MPTRFAPELPNPVSGEDQARFGYPVTLQLGMKALGRSDEVQMALHEGSESGMVVECWYSTPANPTNKDLVPAHSFALIPKAPLKSGTLYTVVAQVPQLGELAWSFKT